MAEKTGAQRTASGVEALIARLRDEGVGAGRTEAERIVGEAQVLARATVEEAEEQAAGMLEKARREAANLQRAGEDALKAAARDTVLDLKDYLSRRFAGDVAKTVSAAMRDEELLKRMILAVAGRVREEAGVDRSQEVVFQLPRAAVGLDELRRRPEELKEGSLTHFAAASAAAMLREGVTFARADDDAGGLRIQLLDRGVSVDLTDQAVADMILAHLQPRFRALLEGVVK
ncbi:V/A-type H+-transporting ATPase subunit E [Pseudochelatococcus lubricantis]|uniref:V/A-type H+-transporting ATPase subunit E n=1 Tax=Pseudochelatococcus lubricantis TaxID=1538102 RepID=A0ABX0V5F8_9HYPH|nr:hypothetical protein [Pseudochelatococcus lubricantis]NIJ58356.1 V/A-type H+-transporting ATPase subunit E [Pseudochelatococcus lubricantis]